MLEISLTGLRRHIWRDPGIHWPIESHPWNTCHSRKIWRLWRGVGPFWKDDWWEKFVHIDNGANFTMRSLIHRNQILAGQMKKPNGPGLRTLQNTRSHGKVVTLHHHPVPIPQTRGVKQFIRFRRSSWCFNRQSVDFVLLGHNRGL